MSERLTVQFKVQADKVGEFEKVLAGAASRVRAEDKGCEMYNLFKSVDDDTNFVLVESWATPDDLKAHGKSPAMAEMGKIAPMMAGAPVIHRYND